MRERRDTVILCVVRNNGINRKWNNKFRANFKKKEGKNEQVQIFYNHICKERGHRTGFFICIVI